jgi:hypothetical protein
VKAAFKSLLLALFVTAHLFAAEGDAATDPFMAEYDGFWTAGTGAKGRVTAQIRPIAKGQYDGFILLTRAKSPVTAIQLSKSAAENGTLKVAGTTARPTGGDLLGQSEVSGEIRNGKLAGKFSGDLGEGTFEATKIARKSPTLGAKPPRGAVVLLDASGAKGWENLAWPVTKDGVLQVGKDNIWAKEKIPNYQLHVEFRTPLMPEATGQDRGNSGVYLQGKYEVQVLDSFGLYPLQDNDCGGVYKVKSPIGNACLPPGQWQTYDITFLEGNATRTPRITVELNGVKVIDRAEVPANLVEGGTGGGNKNTGFLMLQNHGNPVEFRNIWAQPILSAEKLR